VRAHSRTELGKLHSSSHLNQNVLSLLHGSAVYETGGLIYRPVLVISPVEVLKVQRMIPMSSIPLSLKLYTTCITFIFVILSAQLFNAQFY